MALLLNHFAGRVSAAPTNTAERTSAFIVVGAPGEKEYGEAFAKWAALWTNACTRGEVNSDVIGLDVTNDTTDLTNFQHRLENEATNSNAELWIVFIGHGTFDGREAKFNLRGPDLSATELSDWLKPFHRPVVLIDCTSSSSPFLSKLSAPGRVIVTATRSGYEQNYTRFGEFFAKAIADPAADLDKDGETSVLEAFVMASRQVAELYASDGRLATEHALLDDNGDALGTPADWFQGVRAIKKPESGASVDGLRANQICLIRSEAERRMSPEVRARRDQLELEIAKLRDSKDKLKPDEYYYRLEKLLIPLAKLYQEQPE